MWRSAQKGCIASSPYWSFGFHRCLGEYRSLLRHLWLVDYGVQSRIGSEQPIVVRLPAPIPFLLFWWLQKDRIQDLLSQDLSRDHYLRKQYKYPYDLGSNLYLCVENFLDLLLGQH